MGLFYAYAKNVSDDRTWRYLIVFASRTVADEWWRAVSVCTNPAFVKSIQRVGPQYYTHEPGTANIQATIVTPNVAPQFLGRVIFTLLADRDGREFSVIPIQDVTDHISGNWFYIRSGGAYWYRTPVGGIIASQTHSTRFQIRIVDPTLSGSRAVMIGSDSIYLYTGSRAIMVSQTSGLQEAVEPQAFVFSDFADGFRINGSGLDSQPGLSANAIVKTNLQDGEVWELSVTGSGIIGDTYL